MYSKSFHPSLPPNVHTHHHPHRPTALIAQKSSNAYLDRNVELDAKDLVLGRGHVGADRLDPLVAVGRVLRHKHKGPPRGDHLPRVEVARVLRGGGGGSGWVA